MWFKNKTQKTEWDIADSNQEMIDRLTKDPEYEKIDGPTQPTPDDLAAALAAQAVAEANAAAAMEVQAQAEAAKAASDKAAADEATAKAAAGQTETDAGGPTGGN